MDFKGKVDMAECNVWDDIYDQREKEIKEAMKNMKSTTGFDDQFIVHPDDEKEKITEKDIPEDVGVFKEDELTEDFPFEIKAIFWVMVAIVAAWATGIL